MVEVNIKNPAIRGEYAKYIEEYNSEPKYAQASVIWKNGDILYDQIFKLSCDFKEEEDEYIFFYLNDAHDLDDFCSEGVEDFIINPKSVKFLESI